MGSLFLEEVMNEVAINSSNARADAVFRLRKKRANGKSRGVLRALGPGGLAFFLTLDCKLACPERFELAFPMHLRKRP